MLTAVAGAIGIGSQIFAGSKADEQRKQQIKQAQTAAKYEARAQERALQVAEAEQQQQMLTAASQQKRQEQTTMLIAVGGIAVGISLIFILAAMRKK